ncbi:MAG: hypothetical protein KGD63_08365 [Candidatus Lokiarchaeota archaeon]|nr:hypothetical protein [Candidatus Lokiarchaeota archaeon]
MSKREIDIEFLKKLALFVYESISPIIGTKEAAKKIKRGAGGDISMHIDIMAEKIIINELKKNNINIMLISEEVGELIIGDKEIVKKNEEKLIVDPIDGSNNSIRDIPFFCVSIAYAKGSEINDVDKAVILNLKTKDIYWAEKGKGAFFNEEKIIRSENSSLDKLIFEIDLKLSEAAENFKKFSSVLNKIYRIRVMGCVALSFCLFAKGCIDGYINLKERMRVVDIAAAFLIVKESGGLIFSRGGEDLNISLSMESIPPLIACRPNLKHLIKKELKKIHSLE